MNDPHFIKVYDLHDDHQRIANVQQATLNTEDYGYLPGHGLFGSNEWWDAIAAGAIPTKKVEGYISRVYAGGMGGDTPMFEIVADTERKVLEQRGRSPEVYKTGKRAKVTYAIQERKDPTFVLGPYAEVVILIEIEA